MALDDPPCTDFVYALPEAGREAVVRTFRNTYYAVVDPDLIGSRHRILNLQQAEERDHGSGGAFALPSLRSR